MNPRAILLVVAKAPVPGRAKTRLSPPATPEQAADIAASSLLNTCRAVGSVPGTEVVVAWTGETDAAARRSEVVAALDRVRVVPQRGGELGARLAAAHASAGQVAPGAPVLQLGMDTPQVGPDLLESGLAQLQRADAVLGPASDGGWLALGVRDPRWAAVLPNVPMSRPDTGERTAWELRRAGLRVTQLPEVSDVDTMGEARLVAEQIPGARFAEAVREVPLLAEEHA